MDRKDARIGWSLSEGSSDEPEHVNENVAAHVGFVVIPKDVMSRNASRTGLGCD